MGLPLPEPMKVAAHIKLFRWSFLICGVVYGCSRHQTLKKVEMGLKDERTKRNIERDARIAEEKRIASERDIAAIVALMEPPDDD